MRSAELKKLDQLAAEMFLIIEERSWEQRIDWIKRIQADAAKDMRERCVQECLRRRDIADNQKPQEHPATETKDHLMGQAWMANLLAKAILNLEEQLT